MKSDEASLCAQLKSENWVLECGKKRAEDEIEVLKMNFMKLQKELKDYTSKCHGLSTTLKVKEMECVGTESQLKELNESKIGVENELKEYEIMCGRLKEQIIKSLEDKRIASEREKEAKERTIKLEEEIKKMGSDLREKCVEFSKEIIDLKTVNQRAKEEMEIWKKKYTDLECEKRRADGEIELVKKKCRELEIQASEMLNHGSELEDYKTKCHGLSAALKVKKMECVGFEGKLKNLMSAKVALDHELEDRQTTCSRMKEDITGLTNVGKIMSEREKTSHDRIAYFEELVNKMESDEKDMLVQLKNANMVLERGKRRAEDEAGNWKKRFTELEMGLESLQKEYAYDDICEKYMDEYISRKMDGRVNAASVAHLTKSEKVLSPASLPATDFSSFHEMLFEDVHVSDTPNTKSQFDHSADFKVEKKNICSDTKVELVSKAKQQPGSETGGSCKENLVFLKQDGVTTSSICIIEIEDDVIEVSDGEDEKEIPLTHTCNNKGEDIDHASTDGTLKTLNKFLERPLSVWGSLDKNIQFSSTMKRCKVSTSRSVSQEDDKFPNIKI
ncbi:hypothetical protein C5167_036651 [Papaver somniferum]|uniref:Uncharacterized protein n=2 Tax=Papaver somniferum TaxID=3469 RepID=A0A4Y7I8I2_PAPSO|nr:hypothetical protein C5167_036651 [Papaver somniferum]